MCMNRNAVCWYFFHRHHRRHRRRRRIFFSEICFVIFFSICFVFQYRCAYFDVISIKWQTESKYKQINSKRLGVQMSKQHQNIYIYICALVSEAINEVETIRNETPILTDWLTQRDGHKHRCHSHSVIDKKSTLHAYSDTCILYKNIYIYKFPSHSKFYKNVTFSEIYSLC